VGVAKKSVNADCFVRPTFASKIDAERHLGATGHDEASGGYVDPARGRVRVAEWHSRWWPTVQKLSVSFAPELAELIRQAADAEEKSVAAWMAEAARHRLKLDAMRAALEAFEAGHARSRTRSARGQRRNGRTDFRFGSADRCRTG
jgi:hypothetical protein